MMRREPKLSSNSVWILFMIWVCLIESTKVNCRLQEVAFEPTAPNNTLPIETSFTLPHILPEKWPEGTKFGTGNFDLGKLQVYQITSFNKVWASYEDGPDNLGATFFEPLAATIPPDFFMLGCYSQPNNKPLYGWVLVAKDAASPSESPALKLPTDYTLIWSSESTNITQDGVAYFWLPVAPDGYTPVGYVVTTSPAKPPLDKVRVVRDDCTESVERDTYIWGSDSIGLHLYTTRPVNRGSQGSGVSVGTFIAEKDGKTMFLSCLSNLNMTSPTMLPNVHQVEALIQIYGPMVYFHPDEQYLPSSVNWFFENGALLYTQGEEPYPVKIEEDGSNLPQNGSNDGTYWIDLPTDKTASDNLKKGNLTSAEAYMHIKPALGGTFTDIVVWLFYPFNGPGKLSLTYITISLSEIGEHVADWEHVTLRISNMNGHLQSVYFSEHNKGIWVSASELEYVEESNNPIVYASKNGHAFYPKVGETIHSAAGAGAAAGALEEKIWFGAQNETAKGDVMMDTTKSYWLLSADYDIEGDLILIMPWLNYAREWGPKRLVGIGEWVGTIVELIHPKDRFAFLSYVLMLPHEALGEEGPIGPKWKDNWSGDETV